MSFTVYKNRVHKYAAVHRGTCGYLKMHGGVSRTTPPTGEYVEGIETVKAARREAASSGWEIKHCSRCGP
ncbi:MAG: hypothetical protein J4F32_04820 [Dehalococcoidia bacterium]|nr:hypothetical protein [Dehalococcoidia bacterium]